MTFLDSWKFDDISSFPMFAGQVAIRFHFAEYERQKVINKLLKKTLSNK